MLTKNEYLLTCLIEECAEVQKEGTKILRFGTSAHHPKVAMTNVEKLLKECIDVLAIFDILRERNFLETTDEYITEEIDKKKERVLRYYETYKNKL